VYALQLYAFRCASCGFLDLPLARKVWNLLYNNFHLLLSLGVWSQKYTAQFIISFHRLCGRLAVIFIMCAFSMITPPKCLVVPFWAWVFGAEGSNVIPWVYSHLRVFFLLSLLSNLIVLTLRLYLRQIHRMKSLSICSVFFFLPCVIIKYRNVLPEKVLWMSITCMNLACTSLRSVQSIWRLIQGLLIFHSDNFCEICCLILVRLQYWHFIVLGLWSLTPRVLIPKWWRLMGPGWPRCRCHSHALPFKSGQMSLDDALCFCWQHGNWLVLKADRFLSWMYLIVCCL